MLNATSNVAVNAPEEGIPVPGVARIPELTTTMYAIVTKVVRPPRMSALGEVAAGYWRGMRMEWKQSTHSTTTSGPSEV